MNEAVKAIIQAGSFCVLATAGVNAPHTSLMAYACSEDASTLYFATPKDTLKYRNLCENPRVSVLIDTRTQATPQQVNALTIGGRATSITEPDERAEVIERLLSRHPHMRQFVQQPDMALMGVTVTSLQLLNGLEKAQYYRVEETAMNQF